MPIKVTPEELRERATGLRTGADTIGGELARLLGDVQSLRASWEGAAAAAFDAYYESANSGFKQVETALYGIADILARTGDQYEQQDQQLAAQFAS